ncbi:MAG: hypothetical protein FJW40_14945 [Acidobacteria bacterium]|nr:hypothetical protein [Acidobacteriota bacterium]
MRYAVLILMLAVLVEAEYRPPAGTAAARRRPGAESVLPGGRMVAPLGRHQATGPGPFGVAVSPSGRMVVTADGGPGRQSLTVLENERDRWTARAVQVSEDRAKGGEDDWNSVFMGLAFQQEGELWVSEGNTGRVRLLDPGNGKRIASVDLNQGGFRDSYTGDLALDTARGILYVVDQANFRVAAVDARRRRVLGSLRVGRLPFAMALAPDGRRLYVTNIGMFEYKPLPGADAKRARETGIPFPKFGFPSEESARELGDPNAPESNSVAVVDVTAPGDLKLVRFVKTGLPFGPRSLGGSSPSGVVANSTRVFVSNGHNDSITVIDAQTLEVVTQIEIRIPGLESYRGILPIGLAIDPKTGWLLIAEAGINAVGVADTRTNLFLGHLPAGWFPTRIAVGRGQVHVVNAKGLGTGPNADTTGPLAQSFQADLRRGSLSVFSLPATRDLLSHTAKVFGGNGFVPSREPEVALPAAIRHVVIIVKENRTFDEVLGDIETVSNGAVRGASELARFGRRGWVTPEAAQLRVRFPHKYVNVTPNHHEIARRWAFSDNFYADSEMSVDGHHWLVGSYPNAWTESTVMARGRKDFRFPTTAPGRLLFPMANSSVHPEEQLEAGALWHHLERHGVSFRNFGEGFELAGVDEGTGLKPTGARYVTNVPMPDVLYRNTSREYPQYNMNIPDQYRASQFLKEAGARWVKGTEEFPRLIFIHLPGDHMAQPRPGDGYPFQPSYVADNDIALGRILEFLSRTKWWREMAVLITEDDAQGGVDHVDSHRTVLMVASPYARKNYVSRVNSSFPGMLKTAFRLLGIPPLNLYDATAADLADCFTNEPDFAPYELQPVNADLFDPAKAKEPLDPAPSPRMDDPAFLRQQHRQR